MTKTQIYLLLIVGLGTLYAFIRIAIEKKVKKAYEKGLKDGRDGVADQLVEASHWFSQKPMICNTLYFMASAINKYGYFNINKLRPFIFSLGDKRYDKLSKEEFEKHIWEIR